MRPLRPLCLAALAAALTACAEMPDLAETVTPEARTAPYPEVMPADRILDGARAATQSDATTQADLESRAAGLRARADRLRRRTLEE